jgi:hypothetical protein
MTDTASDQLNELRGKPVTLKIAGKEITVEKMSMDTQLDVFDLFASRSGETVKDMKGRVGTMVAVLAKVTGITEEEIRTKSDLGDIFDAFEKVWDQNDFSFLAKKVRGLTDRLSR